MFDSSGLSVRLRKPIGITFIRMFDFILMNYDFLFQAANSLAKLIRACLH